MITYTKEAKEAYIKTLTEAQHKLAEIPAELLGYDLTHWLIHTALDDLKKQVEKEWERGE